ncbi:MAG: Gfo/Idh/MocA family oxidoreductase [Bacteroidales bacterium]|nr:Gfo/Idh/MocA family oxidoreductase [Bacteroidales bacterium]
MKKTIRTGIVGFGLSGKVFHAPFLHVHPGFNLTKIVERHTGESKKLYPYSKTVKSFEELLNDDELRLVVICTPNTLHFPMVRESLMAGKDVVVEKPFTPSSAEADELIALAEKKGLHIFVYHNRRWDGDFLTLRKIRETGILGEIKEFESHFDRFRPEVNVNSWREKDLPGSGVLYDLGSHLIDQAMTLFGLPLSLAATIEKQRKNSVSDDYFRIRMMYKNKEVILTAGMLVDHPVPKYIVHGALGSFLKYGMDPQEEALKKGLLPDTKHWGAEDPGKWGMITFDYDCLGITGSIETEHGCYQEFYNNVYRVLIRGEEMAVKPREARNVIRAIELAYESNRSGRETEFIV